MGPSASTELEGVAKTPGGYQAAAHSFALDDGVGGDGGAVDDCLEGSRRNIQGIQRIHAPPGRILGGAGHFRHVKTAGLLVVADHVRERTADVDTHGQSGQRDLRCVVGCPMRGAKEYAALAIGTMPGSGSGSGI